MSVLIVEATEWTPHVETGMEIALRLRAEGEEVHYLLVRGLGHFTEERPFRPTRWYRDQDVLQPKNHSAMWVLRQHGVQLHWPRYRRETAPVPEFADQEALKTYCENGWDIGMGVASSLISWSKCASAEPAAYREAVVRMVRAGRLIYRNVEALCRRLQPRQVILFNGRFASTRPTLRAAQSLGLDWRIHERGSDPDHYFFHDFVPHDLRRWSQQIQIDSEAKPPAERERLAHQFYHRRRAGAAKDWHSFVNWSAGDLGRYAELAGARPVVYFSSSDDEFAAIGEVLKEAAFERQIDAVRCLARECQRLGRPLLVRIHPHLAQKDPADLRFWHESLQGYGATLVDAADKVDSYALMEAASLSVSYGSTAGIESVYWNCQHLLLGRAMYETLPGVVWVREPAQLAGLLASPPPLDRTGAIHYGCYLEEFGERFRHFQPDGLFGGRFLGEPLGGGKSYLRWLGTRLLPNPRPGPAASQ